MLSEGHSKEEAEAAIDDLFSLLGALRDAKVEGELVDSVSGNVISVFRIDEIGNWDDKKGMSWEDLRATLEVSMARAITASRR